MTGDRIPDELDVLVVLGHLGPGGAQRVVATIVPAWVGMGLRVGIWVSRGMRPADRAYPLPDGVWVGGGEQGLANGQPNGIRRLWTAIESVRSLHAVIRRARPEVVLSLLCTTNIKTIVASFGVQGARRIVISERNDPSRQAFPMHIRLARRILYRHADLITANSERALDWLRRIAPRTDMRVLPNPVVRPNAMSDAGYGDGVFEILYVGRLVKQKRIENLVRAVRILIEQGARVRLRLVGEGPAEGQLRQLIDQCGLGAHVHMHGHMKDLEPVFRTASCFGLLSEYEGSPNALLEAMIRRIPPVISHEVNESARLIETGRNGIEVDGTDVAAVARAVGRLLNDSVPRERMGEAAAGVAMRFEVGHVVRVWNRTLGLRAGEHAAAGARATGD